MLPSNQLFNIQQEYLQLLGQIEEAEGEVTPEIDQALQFTQRQLHDKGAQVGEVIKTLEYWQETVEQEIKRLEAIRSKAIKGKELLKNRLSEAMQQFGIERIFTNTLTVSLRGSEAVEITDEQLIPIEFLDPVPPKISKLRIKGAIKDGTNVPGAELVSRKHLMIK